MARITIKRGVLIAVVLFAGIVTAVFLFVSEFQSASPLIVKVSTGKTGPGEIEYIRISVTNNSDKTFTNVVVDMGPAGREMIEKLRPGQTYFASPKSLEGVSEIRVTTQEDITVTKKI
ncbi:MAG: hypothetical protein ACE5J2_02915 [Nitrososphaerales archaeon]